MEFKLRFINYTLFFTMFLLMLLLISNFFMYEKSVFLLEKYLGGHFNNHWKIMLIVDAFLLYFIGVLSLVKRYVLGSKDMIPARIGLLQYIHYGIMVLIIGLFFIFGEITDNRNNILFQEDGFFENFTVVLTLISSFIFVYLGIYYKVMDKKIFLFLFGILLFFYSMEEISWGQRIFDWETPKALSEVNYQNETNVHNLFINPYFRSIYYIFFLFVSSLFLFRDKYIELLSKNKITKIISEMYPSNQYFYAGFIYLFIAFASLKIDDELSEDLLTVTIFIYAVDLLYQKFSNNKLNTNTGVEGNGK